MSQRNTPFNYTGEPSTNCVGADPRTSRVNISTTEQVNQREKQTINGMEFVSIKGQLWRFYDIPTGKSGSTVRIKIDKPEWLHVRESGSHEVIDSEGVAHYIPERWVHLGWKNVAGEPLARF